MLFGSNVKNTIPTVNQEATSSFYLGKGLVCFTAGIIIKEDCVEILKLHLKISATIFFYLNRIFQQGKHIIKDNGTESLKYNKTKVLERNKLVLSGGMGKHSGQGL